MKQERFVWTVSVILLALLATQVPGTLAQRDDEYAFVRTLVDIHRHVANNYVDEVNDEELREGAINGMLGELDPYSIYVPKSRQEAFDNQLEGSFKGVGIQLNQLENGQIEVMSPIENSPAFEAGVMSGDIILEVNGKSTDGDLLTDVIKRIGGTEGSEVTLKVRHLTGEEAVLTMERREIIVPTIKGYARTQDGSWDYYVTNNPKVAYLRITQFTTDTFDTIQKTLIALQKDGMEGLILDLRFNPGGMLDQAEKLIDLFINEGTIVSIKGRNRTERVSKATVEGTLPYFPMVVLVNEHSASASEVVAGSLKDNRRALIVGTRTYGKGSVQEVVPLDGDAGELKLTVAYYYLPSGRLVHRKPDATDWGVEPHIIVPLDEVGQRRVMMERYEQELYKRPVSKSATQPALGAPATQPVDTQLQQAITSIVGLVVLQENRGESNAPQAPAPVTADEQDSATQPTTVPEVPAKPVPPAELESITPETGSETVPVTQPAESN